MNYDSPGDIRETLHNLRISLKKRWGQNFLINRGARQKILSLLDPQPGETVWEIGPGLGCLTVDLVARCRNLTLFEIDHGMIRYLKEILGTDTAHFRIVPGDALKTWEKAAEAGVPDRIIGNLPYSSASALIGSFARRALLPQLMVFTVQKELSQRMTARPGTKAYSSFTIMSRYRYAVRYGFDLKPGSFYPAPKVSSTVLVLTPQDNLEPAVDEQLFFELVQSLFSFRRKTLRNNLMASSLARRSSPEQLLQALEQVGIDPNSRSEMLPVESFVALANRLHRFMS